MLDDAELRRLSVTVVVGGESRGARIAAADRLIKHTDFDEWPRFATTISAIALLVEGVRLFDSPGPDFEVRVLRAIAAYLSRPKREIREYVADGVARALGRMRCPRRAYTETLQLLGKAELQLAIKGAADIGVANFQVMARYLHTMHLGDAEYALGRYYPDPTSAVDLSFPEELRDFTIVASERLRSSLRTLGAEAARSAVGNYVHVVYPNYAHSRLNYDCNAVFSRAYEHACAITRIALDNVLFCRRSAQSALFGALVASSTRILRAHTHMISAVSALREHAVCDNYVRTLSLVVACVSPGDNVSVVAMRACVIPVEHTAWHRKRLVVTALLRASDIFFLESDTSGVRRLRTVKAFLWGMSTLLTYAVPGSPSAALLNDASSLLIRLKQLERLLSRVPKHLGVSLNWRSTRSNIISRPQY